MGGTAAASAEAVEGFDRFTGKAGSAACHAPAYYGNSTFFNIGLEHGKGRPDSGRFNVTENEADRCAFNTPSLRSVARGAPYFYDGSAATLEDAVRYMASGRGADPNTSDLLVDRGLTDAGIGKIIAFLESLTSEESWEKPSIP